MTDRPGGVVFPGPTPGPGLLVSVRSAGEAVEALLGGASVVDVKEPSRGPLGCADPGAWRAVEAAVSGRVPVSVALGELREWADRPPPDLGAFGGIAFRKVGLSGLVGHDWGGLWDRVRLAFGPGPGWVSVAYVDHDRAGAPSPSAVRDASIARPECVGLLLDTWDKSRPADYSGFSPSWFDPIRRSGRFVALAGGLVLGDFGRLSALRPDLLAVRGAACEGGDRGGAVCRSRVKGLVEASRRTAPIPMPVAWGARASIG
ncbi:(5-formylfuran-3-yl)methyl phosphate synthase [Tautonia plasticadhaerens]|uniref:(5-formylfuran-3-yl)methyl phosphate synthase n=1 Tax=Tautonia plasticadhaerens TaxID=2527974 RepID=A0A518HAR7_9BACT|nr:(5-formylfuran-3-yl)methyl phosphate synthase [Tautonia plasticadhaerens]QDV37944.1 hypothetical protein ElP_58910 [Tautonia plasticadhaerens]